MRHHRMRPRWFLLLPLIALYLVGGLLNVWLAGGPALATAHPAPIIHLSTGVLDLLVGVLIPMVTTLLTKKHLAASWEWIRSAVLAALAVLGGALAAAAGQNGNFGWEAAVVSIGATFVAAFATHYGLNNVFPGIQKFLEDLLPHVGVGKEPTPIPAPPPPPPPPAG